MAGTAGISSDLLLAMMLSAWTLLIACVVLIFVRSLSRALLGLFFTDLDVQADQQAARESMIAGLDLLGEWSAGALRVLTQGAVVAFTIFWYLFALLLLSTLLHVLYRYFPATLGEATAGWNEHVGYIWSTHVVNALDAASDVFRDAVGVYNIGAFALVRLPVQAGVHMLANGFGDVTAFGKEVGTGATSLIREGGRWGRALQFECKSTPELDGGEVDANCFDPDLMQYDFVKPMQNMHKAVLHLMDFFPRTCSVAAFPTVLVFYPLTDSELGRGVHYALNSVLNAFVTAPALAVQRYELTRRIALAMPDWGPSFDYAAAAARHIGRAVDNWFDVVLYMAVTAADPDRIVSCDARTGSWDFQRDVSLLQSFGGNKTIITSLTPTVFAISDGHSIEYHHHGRRGGIRTRRAAWPIPVNTSLGMAAVSYARDSSRDDAATSAHPTTALFGCMCTDDALLGIRVQCAVVPYESTEGLPAGTFVTDVVWEVRNTPRRMQCRDTKITVQSVRYQSQRVTAPNEFRAMPTIEEPASCASRSSCTRIDAIVWIMPVCPAERPAPYTGNAVPPGSDGACLQNFRDFSCFPFCFGVRRSFSANEKIVIRSAAAWERSVLLTSRDCVFETPATFDKRTSADALDEDEDASGAWAPNSVLGQRGPSEEAVANAKIRTAPGAGTPTCRPNSDIISSVPQHVAKLQSAADFFVRQYAFDPDRQYATDYAANLYRFNPTDAMLLERQPFVFAGDFALATTTYCRDEDTVWDATPRSMGRCSTVVDAMRVSGSEFNQFSLRHITEHGIPATRRPLVGAETPTAARDGHITLPPTIVRSVRLHNPATSTRDAVWYAVNPDYEMLHCVLRYCREFTELVNCLQISVLSNYDALRIWKVIPQSGCSRDSQGVACPPQTAQSIAIDDAFSLTLDTATFDYNAFCSQDAEHNLYIEHMDAFDPLNIVVAVRRGNAQALYDELWGGGGPANTEPRAHTVFYFVNVQTLQVRENKPWTETPALAGDSGFLCKEMRVMPSLGSAVAETFAAGIMFFKTAFVAITNLPGMVELLSARGRRCELADTALRHSFYEDCAAGALDLSDMFSALHRANIHTWTVLDFAGTALGLLSDDEGVQLVQTYLSGAQVYGENQEMLAYTSVTAASGQLMQAGSGGGGQGFVTLYFYSITTVGSPAFMAGMNLGAAPLGVAEYGWRVFSRSILALAAASFDFDNADELSAAERDTKRAEVVTRTTYFTLMSVFYESVRTDWEELVSMRGRRACRGISLMAGYNTPWGRFLRHWCLAGVELLSGTMHVSASVLAELPVVECVCVRANEHDFGSFVRDTCAKEAPVSLRPLLVSMIAWADDVFAERNMRKQAVMRETCSEFIDQFSDSLYHAFTPWAVAHTAAAEATIELFDWLGVLLGYSSAECADVEKNPFVSVMIPAPIDYFRVCGGTSACRAKCKPFADALQLEIEFRKYQHRLKPMIFKTKIESNMFARNRFTGAEELPLALVSVTELDARNDMCARCPAAERTDCVGVVGMHYAESDRTDELAVRAYCVPLDFQRHVFLSYEWQITDAPGVPVASFFAPVSSNRAIRADFSIPYGDHVLLLSEIVGEDTASSLIYTTRFQRITAWRPSAKQRVQQIASSATLREQCMDVLLGSLPRDGPRFLDDRTAREIESDPIITRVEIIDFFNFASAAFTLDLVLNLNVHIIETVAEASSVQQTSKPVFLRVGWCEAFTTAFAGVRRLPLPRECGPAAASSRATCLPLDQTHARNLMQTILRKGVLMYHPPAEPNSHDIGGYSYLPTGTTAERDGGAYAYPASVDFDRPPVTAPNASLVDAPVAPPPVTYDKARPSKFRFSSALGDILPARAYRADAGGRKMLPLEFRAIGTSLVSHRGVPVDLAGGITADRESVWYAVAGSSIARAWLLDVRYTPPPASIDKVLPVGTLAGAPARLREITVSVERYCNGHVCSGCSTKRLQQLCLSMQSCIIRNCAGALVNNDDLFCNFGLLLESMYAQVTSMYIAAWHALVSIMLAIFETQTSAATPNQVRMEWVSDVFYTIVCETKDMMASLSGVIATLIHKGPDVFSDIGDRAVALINYDVRGAKEVNTEAYQQQPLQIAAIHQFLFQLSILPLYQLFALHRWLVCSSDDVVRVVSDSEFTLSLGELGELSPGDENVAGKWKPCSNAAVIEQIVSATPSMRNEGNLAVILEAMTNDEGATERNLENGVTTFIVELPTNFVLQAIDALAAYGMGVVTGIQDILYNVDDPQCQVSDVTIADAVQCACGDAPAAIVPERRVAHIQDGAFWCSGVLYVAKDDGSYTHIYNPYSMEELGVLLENMDAYLECASSSANGRCQRPNVAVFDTVGVSAMTVLTRCRSNYMQHQWDIGSGKLFDPFFTPPFDYPARPFSRARAQAMQWATDLGTDMATCVRAHAGTSQLASACLGVFLRLIPGSVASSDSFESIGQRAETYFAYTRSSATVARRPSPTNNPDACILFTGPAAYASFPATRRRFATCLESEAGQTLDCELPALAWAGRTHSRVPVAAVHRETVSDPAYRASLASGMYDRIQTDIQKAFERFGGVRAEDLDVMFFSGEGDALHQMLDCMFLGPYTRIDYITTDTNGEFEPLRWSRDAGDLGISRDFELPCSGAALRGDAQGTPFTCGSAARRAIIKKYVREYMLNGTHIGEVTARLVVERVAEMRAAYMDRSLYGCPAPPGGSAGPLPPSQEYCGDVLQGGQGFASALPDFTTVESSSVAEALFRQLDDFFRDVMTDTANWQTYYKDAETTAQWGHWDASRSTQQMATDHVFQPHAPVVSYNESETLRMPAETANVSERLKHSVWGVCTSLLGQPMLTIPLARTNDEDPPHWKPPVVLDGSVPPFTSFPSEDDNGPGQPEPDEWMHRLMHDAWVQSPMYMHYVMRHVPSVSLTCENAQTSDLNDAADAEDVAQRSTVRMQESVLYDTDGGARRIGPPLADIAAPAAFRGFDTRGIGSATRACPCGGRAYTDAEGLVLSSDTCWLSRILCDRVEQQVTAEQNTAPLQPDPLAQGPVPSPTAQTHAYAICTDAGAPRQYGAELVPAVLHELHSVLPAGMGEACPEFTLSDQWGVYDNPVASHDRTWHATPDSLREGVTALVDGMHLWAHRPAGITPSNWAHVANETQAGRGWTHATRRKPLARRNGQTAGQRYCAHSARDAQDGDAGDVFPDSLLDDFFDHLFPVAQLVTEPWGMSTCTRYVLEHYKYYFLTQIIRASNAQTQKESAARWRDRCVVKARQSTVCNALGIYSVVPLQRAWDAARAPSCQYPFAWDEWEEAYSGEFYVTPSCVLFVQGDFYDLHKCWAARAYAAELLLPADASDACKFRSPDGDNLLSLHVENPVWMTQTSDNSVLHWGSGGQFADAPLALELYNLLTRQHAEAGPSQDGIDIAPTRLAAAISHAFVHGLFNNILDGQSGALDEETPPGTFGNVPHGTCTNGMLQCAAAEFCDNIFDWWPDDWQEPVGYHPTATCSANDNAYRTFDSYIAADRESMQLAYHHTALRDARIHYQWAGASGLCRLHNVHQPLLETNSHRACTRAARQIPNPAIPRMAQPLPTDTAGDDLRLYPEACGARSTDVPWAVDATDQPALAMQHPQVRSLGGLFDIFRATVSVPTRNGRTVTPAALYPTLSSLLDRGGALQVPDGPLREAAASLEDKYGLPRASGNGSVVRGPAMPRAGTRIDAASSTPWGPCIPQLQAATCNTADPGACPTQANMRCTQVPEQNEGIGICMSTQNVLAPSASPCYRSDMCDETSHCLAEGVCGRVSQHLWNTGRDDIEFTTLAKDTCGVDAQEQDFAGASPWETVPDLLAAHGMCAQRHRYSYLYAMQHRVLRDDSGAAYMPLVRNGQSPRVEWPWLEQLPSGNPLPTEDDETAGAQQMPDRDRRTLHVFPHPCDQQAMHMPSFKTCSGIRGDARSQMIPYIISHNISYDPIRYAVESWTAVQYDTVPLQPAHWLRTSTPSDLSQIRLNAAFDEPGFRGQGLFNFLGGDDDATPNSYAGVVGRSQASFLRCASIELCGPPEYTFAGRTVDRSHFKGDRRRRTGQVQALTTDDFVFCGSIGFRRENSADGRECDFDIDLFPHVRLLVSGSGETSAAYCNELFGDPAGSSSRTEDVAGIQLVADINLPCDTGVLCCHGDAEATVACKYVGIGADTSGFTPIPVFEALLDKLNNIHRLVTVPASMFAQRTTSRGLSILVECINEISRVNAQYQLPLRSHYDTDTDSGLYHALTYHLFEFPVLWYYKWAYFTLIWPIDTSPLRIALRAKDWMGVIDAGEAWDSRASTRQGTPRRCNGPTCVCQPSAGARRAGAARDALLCLNGGARLRLEAVLADRAGRRSAAALAEDALSLYASELRQGVMARVLDFVRAEYGIDPSDPATYLGGCHTIARWNRETCLKDPACQRHLANIANGIPVDSSLFNPLDPVYADYFVFDGFQLSDATPNLMKIIQDIVDSYEFADEAFDGIRDGALLRSNQTTNDGETKWFYPLFRVRAAPLLTAEYDDVSDDNPDRVFLVPSDPALLETSSTAECIFDDDVFDADYERGDAHVFSRPVVEFSTEEDPAKRRDGVNTHFFDICDNDDAERNVYAQYRNNDQFVRDVGDRLDHPVMSCSFQGTIREHGYDVCDYWGETSCDLRDVVVRSSSLGWKRLRAHFYCTESDGRREFPAANAPNMRCRFSPMHNSQCDNFRTGSKYPGYWAPYARGAAQNFHLEFDLTGLEYQRFSDLTSGFTNNELEFLGTNEQRVWMYQFGIRGKTIKALRLTNYRKNNQNDDWWAHPILADGCPLRKEGVPKYRGTRIVGQFAVTGEFPRPDAHFQPADTFPSEQPLHSMCHRFTSKCAPPTVQKEFYDKEEGKGKTRYARMPPGVAARFYTAANGDAHPDHRTPRAGFPTWAWCPHDPKTTAVKGHVRLRGLDIPVPKKAQPRYYPTMDYSQFHTCTEQYAEDGVQFACLSSDAAESGCYIVSATAESEWFFSKTQDICRSAEKDGACSYSLTLAKNFFCGSGSRRPEDGMIVPPDHPCPPKTRKVLVRGDYVGRRSLWKCTPCLKFEPVYATGRAMCGFRSVDTAQADLRRSRRSSASPLSDTGMLFSRDVVEGVKQFISSQVHSLDRLEEMHSAFTVPFRAGSGDVRFDRTTGTAYTSLHDLQAARDYEKWEGYREGGCQSAVNDADPAENTCMWPGRYDITHMAEKDDFYRSRPSNLQCASKTPRAAEYKRCAPESDAQRAQLRQWVDENYRTALGTWLPVLPPARAVAWKLDRTAVRNPFTLLFAATHRPESQVHAQNVLGESICRRGSRLHSICASLTRSGNTEYYLANPWAAGEFNVFMPDDPQDTLDAMGLDQCQRPGGRWEMCCSCTPAELCCYPDKLCAADAQPEFDENNHFTRPGHSAACQPNAGRYDRGQPIPTDHPTNICLRDPLKHLPQICRHHQGIVGADAGAPVATLSALYHEEPLQNQREPRIEDFLVDMHPSLWAGKTAADSVGHSSERQHLLRMPDALLYPAHLVASAAGAGANLRMHAAQMQRNNNDGTDALYWNKRLVGLHEWVPLLQSEFARDSATALRLYPALQRAEQDGATPYAPAWDCPLRTVAFWGRDVAGFNPIVPDPTRADFMFGGTFYCRPDDTECLRGVHPYVRSREYRQARDYFTPDGRCYFDIQNGQDAATVPTAHRMNMAASPNPCGFVAQAEFIANGKWESTRVTDSARAQCDDIIDWPHQRLQYRNNETDLRGSTRDTGDRQTCALLPRVAPFRIKIISDAPLFLNTSASTSDEGGDCHMGRATQIPASQRDEMRRYEHCITVARTATQAHIRCTGDRLAQAADGGRAAAADRIFTFSRERRLHPVHDILGAKATANTRRDRCGQCDAAETPFATGGGAQRRESETSTGIPVRFSAVRLLARQLARMCEDDETCRLNEPEWAKHGNDTNAFLRALLTTPSGLLQETGSADVENPQITWQQVIDNMPSATDDEPLWQVPWLLHNNGDTKPRGVVDKHQWRTNRRAACWTNLSIEISRDQQETSTFVRPISICDLTGDLQNLCTTLANARSDIAAANCLARGDSCEVLSTFYTPAQWFVTNKAFARETVRDFYRYEASDSCAGEISRVRAAEEENEYVKRDCAATHLETAKNALQYLRLVARLVVAYFRSLATIYIDLFLIIIYATTQQNINPLIADIVFHMELVIRLTLEALKQLLNLIIYFFASIGGMAKWIAHVAYWICVIVTWVIEIIIQVFICIIARIFIEAVFLVVDFILVMLRLTVTIFSFGAASLDLSFWYDIKDAVVAFFESAICEASLLGACAYPYGWENEDAKGHAFLATRCWTNPSQGNLLSDSNLLGCSVSDTCMLDAFASDRAAGELGVCEACPPVDIDSFTRIGCDPLLKRCRCGVPLSTRTGCVRNSDCTGNVPCKLMATSFGPSYGAVDCLDSCRSQAVCLVEETATNGIPPVGQCVCILEPPTIHPCDDAGVLVNLAVQQDLCFFALEHSLASTVGTYTSEIIQQGAVALAPCALLSRAERHLTCQPVQNPSGAIGTYIVGSALVSLPQWTAFQRRLLWQAPSGHDPSRAWAALVPDLLTNASEDWAGTGTCEQLVQAARRDANTFAQDSAILERSALQHCLKWRAVARAALMQHTVPGANDKIFLSWRYAVLAAAARIQHLLDPGLAAAHDGAAKRTAKATLTALHETIAAAFFALSQVDSVQPVAKSLVRTAAMAARAWETTAAAHRVRQLWAHYAGTPWAATPANTPPPTATATDNATTENSSCAAASNSSASWKAASRGYTAIPALLVQATDYDYTPSPRTRGESANWTGRTFNKQYRGRRLFQQQMPELGKAWPVDWSAYTLDLFGARDGQESVCDLADALTESVRVFYNSTSAFYAKTANESNVVRTAAKRVAKNARYVFMHAVPLDKNAQSDIEDFMKPTREGVPDTDWASFTYSSIEYAFEVILGLRPAHLAAFFYPRMPLQEQIDRDLFTFPRILYDMSHCDTEKVMLCSGTPRALLPTIAICLLALIAVGFVFWLSSGTTMLLIFFVLPWVVMWYAYGYSPMCFPLIPTCFMDDVVDAVNSTFPAEIEWPALLIDETVCTRDGIPRQGVERGTVNCFRSCANDQLGFKGWEDPLSWFICFIDPSACKWLAAYLSNTTAFAARYAESTEFFISVLEYGDQSVNAAYHTCAAMTSFYIAPAFLLATWFLLMIGTFISTIVLLLFKTFIFVLNTRSEQPRISDDGTASTVSQSPRGNF